MERLTKKEYGTNLKSTNIEVYWAKVYEKLSAYEDTGLTPEQVKEKLMEGFGAAFDKIIEQVPYNIKLELEVRELRKKVAAIPSESCYVCVNAEDDELFGQLQSDVEYYCSNAVVNYCPCCGRKL